jgi:hypothetical protein
MALAGVVAAGCALTDMRPASAAEAKAGGYPELTITGYPGSSRTAASSMTPPGRPLLAFARLHSQSFTKQRAAFGELVDRSKRLGEGYEAEYLRAVSTELNRVEIIGLRVDDAARGAELEIVLPVAPRTHWYARRNPADRFCNAPHSRSPPRWPHPD